ncbi:hypothetical protein LWI29_010213 [Acer saccharum]|uniref:Uncharacterized protein n=1 Tax=Acer saccharum TaxID=4024 RepID=A0AA39RCB5_ACESA|nr:hypothetical protein LWI29_010213 [Acer saccharum]
MPGPIISLAAASNCGEERAEKGSERIEATAEWRLRTAARKELKRVRKELKRRLRRFSDGDNLSPPVQSPRQPEPDGDDNINWRAEIFISDFRRFLSMEKRMFS